MIKHFIWGSDQIEKLVVESKEEKEKELSGMSINQDDNIIYLYGDVTDSASAEFNKELRHLEIEHLQFAIKNDCDPLPIKIYIQSYGGEVLPALSMSDTITRCRVPVYTYIDGYCASAATLLSVVGTKRFVNKLGFILIHQMSGFAWGKHDELKDFMKNLDTFMNKIRDLYISRTKMSEKYLQDILKRDIWMTSEESLQYGFVDGVF